MKEKTGLSFAEAQRRVKEFGPNRLSKPARLSFFSIAAEEITEPLILLLLVVGFFYAIWGSLGDALTIFIIIVALVFVEVWNEYRAKKAIESLAKLAAPRTKVFRDGSVTEVKTEAIVPGDILVLTPGARIAADSKLFAAVSLQVDESVLTGESFSREKNAGDEVYAGTLVVSGEGKAEVFATGARSRFGNIAVLAEEIKEPKTPLQVAMKALSKRLLVIALFISVAIAVLGFLRGADFRQSVLTGLALAFATIPEELPIIITMVLGLGSYELSQRGFLVKKIRAAEVLGNATVILTDKTGTITENEMQVASVSPGDREQDVVKAALLALTEFSLSPTDRAVGKRAAALAIAQPEGAIVRERAFGDGRKTRAVVREVDGEHILFMSGAPEEVLRFTEVPDGKAEAALKEETAKGRRVIAVARKIISPAESGEPLLQLEHDMDFVGLVSLEDPPRPGVREAVAAAKRAGIRIVMVTGDHPATASFIARSVGIPGEKALTGAELDALSDEALSEAVKETSVFARTSPQHKYRLAQALQRNGEIVEVTGDGVNDTLALKAADVGIAMGERGTDAAREAADAVLADDNFTTIARGIFEGRKFFDNVRKGTAYYLSAKLALVLSFLLPVLMGVPFPFAPIQIIVLELFMDLGASAAFVAELAEGTIYSRPPRNPRERFLDSALLKKIGLSGLGLFAAVSVCYLYALSRHLSFAQTQTFAFSGWIIGHVLLAFVSRSEKEPLWRLGLLSNRVMGAWAVSAFIFLFAGTSVPVLASYFKLAALSVSQFGIIFAIALAAIGWLELRKAFSPHRGLS
ncbi:MAG: cation-transporting P-type ATPase [Nitrospirota bacterium]